MWNHESINRIEQNKEQGAQCVNKHKKNDPKSRRKKPSPSSSCQGRIWDADDLL